MASFYIFGRILTPIMTPDLIQGTLNQKNIQT